MTEADNLYDVHLSYEVDHSGGVWCWAVYVPYSVKGNPAANGCTWFKLGAKFKAWRVVRRLRAGKPAERPGPSTEEWYQL